MAATVFSLILLCVLFSCQLSDSQVLSPPTSQEVILNRNASFTCNTSTNRVKWVINGSHSETKTTLYPSDLLHIPLLNGSISLIQNRHSDQVFINKLIVLGSYENNNTEIDCQTYRTTTPPTATTAPAPTIPALLTVIGPPDPPVSVTGYVLQFSPLQVRLEWVEPFSHQPHHILHYTVYTESTQNETNATNITLNVVNMEFSRCKVDIGVTATSDIGESKLSNVTSVLKVPTEEGFIAVDGKLLYKRNISTIELLIQFPELCPGQQLQYTVEVAEVLSGETVYRDTATSEYDGEVLLYSHTTSSLRTTVNYSVVVYLETGKGSVSSTPLDLNIDNTDIGKSGMDSETGENGMDSKADVVDVEEARVESDSEENKTKTDLLLMIIALLSAVVVMGFVTVAVIAAIVFARKKQLVCSGSKKAKQVTNPIYEGALYETVEEQQSHQTPPTSTVQTMSTEVTTSTDNTYQSIPISIPSEQMREERKFENAVVIRKGHHSHNTEEREEVREEKMEEEREEEREGAYTIMSTPTGISFTPSREDRATWLVNRD